MKNKAFFIFLFTLFNVHEMVRIVVTKTGGTGFQPVKGHSQDGCVTKSVNYFLASVKGAKLTFKVFPRLNCSARGASIFFVSLSIQ